MTRRVAKASTTQTDRRRDEHDEEQEDLSRDDEEEEEVEAGVRKDGFPTAARRALPSNLEFAVPHPGTQKIVVPLHE